jgi:addiction module HigA family antidote
MNREVAWPHPGEMLLEEFLKPMGISQYRLAKAINVPARRINEIVKGQRSISADTALRFAAFFGTDAQSWVNLQTDYDLAQAKVGISDVLGQIPRWSMGAVGVLAA